MTPQVLVRYPRKVIFIDSSSIGQIPRNVYSMTPQVLLGYLKRIFNDSSSIGQIPRKVYSMTPQVLVRYLGKYIQ